MATLMRMESDSLGQVEVPISALYGSNTVRALQNFPINERTLGQEHALVRALGLLKKACARANAELGAISQPVCDAIGQACDEMMEGKLSEHLLVPILEGSGGTSTNMNVNEVLANRALQIMGEVPGSYATIHPNDHVNIGQSTNDVFPSAIKLACHDLACDAISSIERLAVAMKKKATEFSEVYRLGRTCLQDAQPMTLGQAFDGYQAVVQRAADSLRKQQQKLLTLPLGGTAIGTGLGSTAGFKPAVFRQLNSLHKYALKPCANSFDGMQNLDELTRLSAELETGGGIMAKIAKDFILLSSGPHGGLAEISLPSLQAGSSIMPGKVNPVIPMLVVQLAQLLHGNHCCVTMACQDGMLEINHYEHTIASRLFDSLHRTTEIADVFARRCVDGIEADAQRSLKHLTESCALATTLVPKLGYSAVSQLVKQSVKEGRPFLALAGEQGLVSREAVLALIKASVVPP